nr:cytochrome P450 [Tamarix hispida]
MSASSCCLSASQILASSPPALQGSPLSSPLTIILINGVTIKILLPLLVLAISLFYVLYLQQRYDHHDAYRQRNKDLPPGSMGWPYVGETLKLYTQNPNSFFSNRQERYGDIFKSHILGCPCVMISNPEAAKLILVSKAHMFKPTYPPSKMKMIGPQALFFHQGDYHSSLKRLIQASFTPSSVASSVSEIESIALNLLIPAWERSINDGNGHNTVINTLREMKKVCTYIHTCMHTLG